MWRGDVWSCAADGDGLMGCLLRESVLGSDAKTGVHATTLKGRDGRFFKVTTNYLPMPASTAVPRCFLLLP